MITDNIEEFAAYCIEYAENIFVVQNNKAVRLSDTKDSSYEMFKLWMAQRKFQPGEKPYNSRVHFVW